MTCLVQQTSEFVGQVEQRVSDLSKTNPDARTWFDALLKDLRAFNEKTGKQLTVEANVKGDLSIRDVTCNRDSEGMVNEFLRQHGSTWGDQTTGWLAKVQPDGSASLIFRQSTSSSLSLPNLPTTATGQPNAVSIANSNQGTSSAAFELKDSIGVNEPTKKSLSDKMNDLKNLPGLPQLSPEEMDRMLAKVGGALGKSIDSQSPGSSKNSSSPQSVAPASPPAKVGNPEPVPVNPWVNLKPVTAQEFPDLQQLFPGYKVYLAIGNNNPNGAQGTIRNETGEVTHSFQIPGYKNVTAQYVAIVIVRPSAENNQSMNLSERERELVRSARNALGPLTEELPAVVARRAEPQPPT